MLGMQSPITSGKPSVATNFSRATINSIQKELRLARSSWKKTLSVTKSKKSKETTNLLDIQVHAKKSRKYTLLGDKQKIGAKLSGYFIT